MRAINKDQDFGYTLFSIGILVFMIATIFILFKQQNRIETLTEDASRLNKKVIELQEKYDDNLMSIQRMLVDISDDIEEIKNR